MNSLRWTFKRSMLSSLSLTASWKRKKFIGSKDLGRNDFDRGIRILNGSTRKPSSENRKMRSKGIRTPKGSDVKTQRSLKLPFAIILKISFLHLILLRM